LRDSHAGFNRFEALTAANLSHKSCTMMLTAKTTTKTTKPSEGSGGVRAQ